MPLDHDETERIGHLFDIAVVTPVFREGEVVGLMGTVGHVSGIGGTKDSLRAREIFEEGFQIPPLKIFNEGKPDETFFALFRENVRKIGRAGYPFDVNVLGPSSTSVKLTS